MAYAEKKSIENILEVFLFLELGLNRIQETASEARGSVESPQALAGASCDAINVVNDRYSLPTARRVGASQAGLWVKSYRVCSRLIGSSGGA